MAVNEQVEIDNKQRKDEEIIKPLPVWKLFRYATPFDVLLIIIASLLSAIAGTAIPLLIMIIGLAVTEYADFVTADTILTLAANNITIVHFCDNTTFTGFLDYLLSSNPVSRFQYQLYYLSFGIVAVAVVYFVTLTLNGSIWSLIANRQEKKIKVSFIHSVLHQDIEYFDLHVVTELPNRLLSDVPSITAAISSALGELVFQMSSMITSFVIAVYFDWILALVVSSLLPVLLIVLFVFGQMSLLAVGKELTFLTRASSIAEQAILSIRTVISYGGQESEEKRYESYLQSGIRYSYLKAFTTTFIFSFYTMLVFSVFSLGFWYGGQRFIACSGITAGDILIVSFLIAQLCLSTGYLVLPLDTLNKALVGGAAVFNVIDSKPMIYVDDDNDKLSLESIDGCIQFSDVTFNYPSRPDVQILNGIDLHIKPGQTMAFVGPSGCGKSTIMSLIPRIYDTTAGSILLDGHDIKEMSVKWLRSRIGIVSQEPALFNISIALNIKAGRNATQEEIEAAAEIANAHDFIMDLPNEYETIVGEGGGQISGGQKQRIAIARALIGNPRILLLDEATSALDTKSEKLVQQALDKAREGRTTIIIAHRLSTIQTADVIVGINEGRVVEMGSHSELMEKQGLYYRLVMNQDNDEDERDLATTVPERYGRRKSIFDQLGRRGSSEIRRGSSGIRRGSSVIQKGRSVIQRGTVKDNRLKRRRSTVNPPVPQQNQTSFQLEDIAETTDIDDNDEIDHLYSLKGILLLLKSEWWIMVVGILAFCFIGIQDSSIYILMSMTLEIFSETDPAVLENDLNLFVYLFIGFGLVGAFFYIIGTPCLLIGSDRSAKTIRVQLYRKYLSQDIQFFDKEDNTVANLLVSLTEHPKYITQVTGIPIGFVVRVMFALIASIVVSLYGSWVLSLITLPAYVFLIGAFFCNTKFSQFYSKKYINEHLINSNNMAIESIENVQSVGTLGVADIFTSRYDQLISPAYKHILVKDFVRSLSYGISQSSVIFVCGIALAVSGIIFVKDTNSPFYASYNNIFLVLSAVIFTGTILKDAFNSLSNLDNAKFSAGETHQYLSENPKINSDGDDDIIPESFSADIKATNLCFSYPSRPGQYILKGLDITIQSGKTLALVGSSGSGKSTIISIIERFYDHTSGNLQLGGTDIRNLNASWLRQQIATVSQEPVLFDMSIADNIRYGTNIGQVTNEEIESAAKSANIHEFILSLPEGYNTNVGLKGTQLSGGQKQRIAITRALVRNPKILLLDEATSALDTESEKIVQEALDKAREGRTTIMIAHRLSTIQTADCIAVVHRGRVIEQGTHSELMERKGAYYNMQHIL